MKKEEVQKEGEEDGSNSVGIDYDLNF